MPSEFLLLTQQFYKLAIEVDVAQRLKMLDSWNGVTDSSIPRIFFQELKNKPGEYKDKIKATKLLFEIKKTLSKFQEYAVFNLNSESHSLFFPEAGSEYYFNYLDNLINQFRPLIKSFGGADSFHDEQIAKLFRAIKIYIKFKEAWITGRNFPLKLYAELIYVDETEIFGKLKKKIQIILDRFSELIKEVKDATIEYFQYVCDFCAIASDIKNDSFLTKDKLKEIVEDYENYNEALGAVKTFLVQFFELNENQKTTLFKSTNFARFDGTFKKLYTFSIYENKNKLENIFVELKTTKSFSSQMQEFIAKCQ